MKFIPFFIALFITATGFTQNPREVELGSFDTIKVYDLITVNLVKSTEDKIIISGQDASDVEFVHKNGTLKVRMAFDRQFDGTKTFVHVHYTSLKTIDGNEGSVITSNELIEQPQLEIRVQEGARVKAGVIVENLDIKAVSGGITEVSGTVDQQNISVNTGGIVENRALKSKSTNIKVRAGGEVEVHAMNAVDISIQAGGDVVVFGSPREVKQKTFAGGRIKIME
ncbi:MAG: head GIN domain-containing protein [Nonlabens sp.]|uniref:head GIN domain-containing protein n=1 Tax=Nonlabens sp. TaxID=1888209 RepID=UPI003EF9582E